MVTEIVLEKTICAYRGAIFLCCYAQQALLHSCSLVHEMHDCMCVPSEIKLEVAIEAPEANLMSNENATDYAKRLLDGLILHCLQLSERL
jgi:hypothetical protein